VPKKESTIEERYLKSEGMGHQNNTRSSVVRNSKGRNRARIRLDFYKRR